MLDKTGMRGALRAGVAGLALVSGLLLGGCATESSNTLPTETVATYGTSYSGPKSSLAIGQFANTSPYLRGLFSDGVDRLGGQAKTILKTHLSQTGRFMLLDRDNMAELERESEIAGPLGTLHDAHPHADIGSYPFSREGRIGTSLVVRGTDEALLEEIAGEMRELVVSLGGEIIEDN